MSSRRWLVFALLLVLIGALVATVDVAVHLRDQRGAARAALVHVQQDIRRQATNFTTEIRSLKHGYRSQVDWDKSHLLDRWTGIVRLVPRSRLVTIFGTLRGGGLIRSARVGSTLGHYVRRCASDAVP